MLRMNRLFIIAALALGLLLPLCVTADKTVTISNDEESYYDTGGNANVDIAEEEEVKRPVPAPIAVTKQIVKKTDTPTAPVAPWEPWQVGFLVFGIVFGLFLIATISMCARWQRIQNELDHLKAQSQFQYKYRELPSN